MCQASLIVSHHTCARRRSGALVCQGDDDYGQHGGAEETFSTTPVLAWSPGSIEVEYLEL